MNNEMRLSANALQTAHEILSLLVHETPSMHLLGHLLGHLLAGTEATTVIFAPAITIGDMIVLPHGALQHPTQQALLGWEPVLNGIYCTTEQCPEEWQAFSSVWVRPLVNDGYRMGIVVLLADMTLDRAHEAIFETICDGLYIVLRQLMIQTQQEKILRDQYEFVRIVSHDLRSPLTSMRGFASMLEAGTVGTLNPQQLHYIAKVLSGVTQMASQIDNISDAGRYDADTGFYVLERTPLDVGETIRSVSQNYLLPADKTELSLTVNVQRDLPIISADAVMLERALVNLVDNAVKYSPNGTSVEIGATLRDSHMIIWVRDMGYGISAENIKRLFQRHVRIRRPEHKLVKGSGLGLFIVRSVALRHGGDAFVESVEGQGSTFGISLPLAGDNLVGNTARPMA